VLFPLRGAALGSGRLRAHPAEARMADDWGEGSHSNLTPDHIVIPFPIIILADIEVCRPASRKYVGDQEALTVARGSTLSKSIPCRFS